MSLDKEISMHLSCIQVIKHAFVTKINNKKDLSMEEKPKTKFATLF